MINPHEMGQFTHGHRGTWIIPRALFFLLLIFVLGGFRVDPRRFAALVWVSNEPIPLDFIAWEPPPKVNEINQCFFSPTAENFGVSSQIGSR